MPCIKSLIADYKEAAGVCPGSVNDGGYPVSDTSCVGAPYFIQQGLCSEATESLLPPLQLFLQVPKTGNP